MGAKPVLLAYDENGETQRADWDGPGHRRRHSRPKGLMIGGLATLGATYALTAVVGLNLIAKDDPYTCHDCGTIGRRFLIPVLGPWLALPASDTTKRKVVTTGLGIAQATGLVLSIIGIERFADSAPRSRWASNHGVAVGLLPANGGGVGMLAGVF